MSGGASAVAAQAATVITAAAVVVAVLLWVATRQWRPTMPVFLELLLAAGLLRLGASDDWHTIAGAAAIVVIRTMVRGAVSRTLGSSSTGIRTSLRTGLRTAVQPQFSRVLPRRRA